jgi:predicted transcriptional regulator
MEVHFSPDVETRLQQVASANGEDAEPVVKDTVARMRENQARFIAGVQRGIEQADHGELVEHKDVLNRIDRLFQSVRQIRRHVVVYRSTGEIVEILHIWHGAQDWRREFGSIVVGRAILPGNPASHSCLAAFQAAFSMEARVFARCDTPAESRH